MSKKNEKTIFQVVEEIDTLKGKRTTLETQLNDNQNLIIVEYSDANGVVYFATSTTYFPKVKA